MSDATPSSGKGKKTIGIVAVLLTIGSVVWFALRPRLQKRDED